MEATVQTCHPGFLSVRSQRVIKVSTRTIVRFSAETRSDHVPCRFIAHCSKSACNQTLMAIPTSVVHRLIHFFCAQLSPKRHVSTALRCPTQMTGTCWQRHLLGMRPTSVIFRLPLSAHMALKSFIPTDSSSISGILNHWLRLRHSGGCAPAANCLELRSKISRWRLSRTDDHSQRSAFVRRRSFYNNQNIRMTGARQ